MCEVSLHSAHLQCMLLFLDGENEEKVDGITTLLGNFKKRKVGSGGSLIASAMHFSCCWKKIFSSLISGECSGAQRLRHK